MSEVGCLKDGHFQNFQVEGVVHAKKTVVHPVVVATVAGVSISSADSGRTIPIDMSTADSAIILPTAVVGLNYKFVLTADAGALANNGFISAGPVLIPTQYFWGRISVHESGVTGTGGPQNVVYATTTQNRLCLSVDSTLTGGSGGDHLAVECLKSGSWHVAGHLTTTGTPNATVTPMFTAAEIAA